MFKNPYGFWGSASDPAGELTTLPQTPSRERLLAFGNRSFAPSALALSPNFSRSVPPKLHTDFRLCAREHCFRTISAADMCSPLFPLLPFSFSSNNHDIIMYKVEGYRHLAQMGDSLHP